MEGTVKLLTFGRGGHTLYGENWRCQGYCEPDNFLKPYHWWADPPEVERSHLDGVTIPDEGIPVVDMRAAVETKEGYAWVFKGPLVDTEKGEGEECPEPSPLFASAIIGGGGIYSALLSGQLAKAKGDLGPLDSVPIREYVALWAEHGASIGWMHRSGEGYAITWMGENSDPRKWQSDMKLCLLSLGRMPE